MVDEEIDYGNQSTLSAGCFDGHADASEQWMWHRLM
jgi:hypothetical protein